MLKCQRNSIFVKIKNKLAIIISKRINHVYEWVLRKRLKNNEFSIVCSNCIGGVIYNRLGKKFLSPTINLWMNQKDFLKFILNLDNYLSKELDFINGEFNYPIAMLDDIKIYFNHSQSQQEAMADWERRKKRINKKNLYIIMWDRDGLSREDIIKLKDLQCKNKIVFSEKKYPDIDYVFTMKKTGKLNGQQCMDKDFFGFRTFEKQWDYVKWLNCK